MCECECVYLFEYLSQHQNHISRDIVMLYDQKKKIFIKIKNLMAYSKPKVFGTQRHPYPRLSVVSGNDNTDASRSDPR